MTNRERELADSGLEYAEGFDRVADEQANAELDARATEMVNAVIAANAPPKCSNCGGEEFQIVEDVPRAYRHHELVDGVLVFDPETQEVCWDGCGGTYQYLECRKCQTRMTDIPFAFEDPEDAHTGFDADDGLVISILCEDGLVEDVYCSNRKAVVEVLYRDDIEGCITDVDVALAQEEEKRVSERVAEIIADKGMHCVH